MRTDHAVDRRRFLFGTAATALHRIGVLSAQTAAAVELGSIDGSVGGNQFTPVQFLDYLSSIKLTWAMISLPAVTLQDEAAIKQIRDHADRLGIKLQLAFGSVCPSARAFNAQNGTLEDQVARALKASQIFGAKCMRCILGGDPERPQIEMHIDNMIKAVRAIRPRIVDSGIKLAVENHGGDLQAREMKMMIEAIGTDIMGVCLDREPGVDARGPAHDPRDVDPLRRDFPRPRQRGVEGARGHRRPLGEHGRRQRGHRRLDPQVHPGQTRDADHLREPGLGEPADPPHLRPEILGQLAPHAGLGAEPVPGGRRKRHAKTGDAAAPRARPPVSSESKTWKCACAIRAGCCSVSRRENPSDISWLPPFRRKRSRLLPSA